jgi:hypothetical protein
MISQDKILRAMATRRAQFDNDESFNLRRAELLRRLRK